MCGAFFYAKMGKGARAHFPDSRPPLSSSDLLHKKIQSPPILYNGTTIVDHEELIETAPLFILISTYLSYLVLIAVGHTRDLLDRIFYPKTLHAYQCKDGVAPLSSGFDTFYHRRLYSRIKDCFERPITNVPGRTLTLLERTRPSINQGPLTLTGKTREALNLSSYNYLGFAQSQGPCADAVEEAIKKYGVSTGSSRSEVGTNNLHLKTEKLVAEFLGQEDAIIVSMGFATNSTCLPAFVGKGCLIISDELNHSSLVFGSRLSGAAIKIFKHNNWQDLELVLREAIAQGQNRTHRPWKKILVVVEGLYSMEGNIVCLPEILELKKKYRFYLYLDEAHSIGALGPNGRGVCDYYGVDPNDVDLLMGTFTKSFGAAGGYIAGKKTIIDSLRLHSHSSVYAESISIPVIEQIYTSMKIIMGAIGGEEGIKLSLIS